MSNLSQERFDWTDRSWWWLARARALAGALATSSRHRQAINWAWSDTSHLATYWISQLIVVSSSSCDPVLIIRHLCSILPKLTKQKFKERLRYFESSPRRSTATIFTSHNLITFTISKRDKSTSSCFNIFNGKLTHSSISYNQSISILKHGQLSSIHLRYRTGQGQLQFLLQNWCL